MIVFLQLTTAGVDSGPFDLYSNLDGYSEPFEENVSRDSLVAGYSTTVPDNATIVRITSKEDCISSVDITLRDVECNLEGYTGEITTTSTSTSSTTTTSTSTSSTTTTTTTSAPLPEGSIVVRNNINTGSGQTLNSLSDISWTTLDLSDFPIPQSTSRFGGHFGYSGNLTINATVTSNSRVEITKNAILYLCIGQIGTGSQNYVFSSIVFAPTDDIVITLQTGDTCP